MDEAMREGAVQKALAEGWAREWGSRLGEGLAG